MTIVNVDVEVSAEDVLEELSDEELARIVAARTKISSENPAVLLERVYEEFRTRGDAPQCLRDYIWDVLGRIL
jgi:hypothetical protein